MGRHCLCKPTESTPVVRDDALQANRRAPTLEFAPPSEGLDCKRTLEDMVEGFEPESQMEREIAAILESSGAGSEERIVRMEDEHALKSMSLAELKKKRGQLAKMRSLLFHHEIKARHIKKIKSKEYHRRLQRAIRKKAVKFGGLDSDAAAKKMLEDMAYNRMKERLTQKHSTMNRFARRIMRRGWGVADEQTKQALEEQLRQSQELKQKIKSAQGNSTDEDASSFGFLIWTFQFLRTCVDVVRLKARMRRSDIKRRERH